MSNLQLFVFQSINAGIELQTGAIDIMRKIVMVGSLLILEGCGLTVPNIQEYPLDSVAGQELVFAIGRSVQCALVESVSTVIRIDKDSVGPGENENPARIWEWFDEWGANLSLSLTIAETSKLGSSAIWTHPEIFGLRGGGSISSESTRINKINYSFSVAELSTHEQQASCIKERGNGENLNSGSLLTLTDLKIDDALIQYLTTVAGGVTNASTKPSNTASFTHQVRFNVVSSGNITPAWRLQEVEINKSGNLLSSSRDRTHDLLVTFGPLQSGTTELVNSAASAFRASEIGVAINRTAL